MRKKEQETFRILGRKTLLKGFFDVEELLLRHGKFDGAETEPLKRYVLHRPDATAAVLHDPVLSCCYFVRQFRVGMSQKEEDPWSLELPAGLVDPGEKPETAIRREILEETGFKVSSIRLIDCIYPSPGIITERIFLYYAQVKDTDRIASGGGYPGEGEDLEVVRLSIDEITSLIREKKIRDAKTLLGLFATGGSLGIKL